MGFNGELLTPWLSSSHVRGEACQYSVSMANLDRALQKAKLRVSTWSHPSRMELQRMYGLSENRVTHNWSVYHDFPISLGILVYTRHVWINP
jgi:hypothetical protein